MGIALTSPIEADRVGLYGKLETRADEASASSPP